MSGFAIWKPEDVDRLRELAGGGEMGQNIASILSSELGRVITPDAVFHKASKEGISLRGRSSPFGETGTISDPFGLNGVPLFLKKEIQAELESVSFEKPKRFTTMYTSGDDPDSKILNDELIHLWEADAYSSMWAEFAEDVCRRGFASESEKDSALASIIPRWFLGWVEPFIVIWHWSMLFDRRVDGYTKKLRGLVELASPDRRPVLSEFVDGFVEAARAQLQH